MLMHVKSPDGVEIGLEKSGSGSPVLLVHGTSSDRTRWLPVMKAFEARHTVYVMDRRGRGASSDGKGPHSMTLEFADVTAAIDGAAAAENGPIDVVGHSYGAICSIEASVRTKNIRRLVLYEPPITMPGVTEAPGPQLAVMEKLLAAGDRKGVLETFYLQVLRAPAAEWEALQKLPNFPARLEAAHAIPRELTAVRSYEFEPERFRDMKTPTLLMLGGDSAQRFRAATDLLRKTFQNSQICILPGQLHNAINTAPPLFWGEVLKFLEG